MNGNQAIAVSRALVCQALRVFHDDADFDMHLRCSASATDFRWMRRRPGDTSGLRVALTKSYAMPKIGTDALDVLGHVSLWASSSAVTSGVHHVYLPVPDTLPVRKLSGNCLIAVWKINKFDFLSFSQELTAELYLNSEERQRHGRSTHDILQTADRMWTTNLFCLCLLFLSWSQVVLTQCDGCAVL